MCARVGLGDTYTQTCMSPCCLPSVGAGWSFPPGLWFTPTATSCKPHKHPPPSPTPRQGPKVHRQHSPATTRSRWPSLTHVPSLCPPSPWLAPSVQVPQPWTWQPAQLGSHRFSKGRSVWGARLAGSPKSTVGAPSAPLCAWQCAQHLCDQAQPIPPPPSSVPGTSTVDPMAPFRAPPHFPPPPPSLCSFVHPAWKRTIPTGQGLPVSRYTEPQST